MKTNTLILAAAMIGVASVAAFGQGFFDYGDNFGSLNFIQPIFAPNPANPYVEQMGNPAGVAHTLPSGGTTIFGGPLLGSPGYTDYDVALYAGPSGVTSIGDMTLITTEPFRTATANILPAGLFLGGNGQIGTGNLGGTPYNFYFVAFSTEGGSVSSYSQALANFDSGTDPNAQIGNSLMFTLILGGVDSSSGLIDLSPVTTNWTSFSLIATPEPSTIALVGLGAAGLLSFRRRR